MSADAFHCQMERVLRTREEVCDRFQIVTESAGHSSAVVNMDSDVCTRMKYVRFLLI